VADRDDLAELIAPDTMALERSLGARAERGEQARAGADRILAAGWVKATDDLRERLRFELYAAGHPEGTAEGPMAVYLDNAVDAALRALHPGEA
jgi:hypothetical protein